MSKFVSLSILASISIHSDHKENQVSVLPSRQKMG